MLPNHVEIEVKFAIEDPAPLRSRLVTMGAVSEGETFETNYRFDDPKGRLQKAGCLLRLRQARGAVLTFKRPHPDEDGEFKRYDEYEVVVADFDRMNLILDAIGFQRVQMYEKRRETFRWRAALICVDQLPYGNFIEIEGPPEIIRDAARQLGLAWERRILTNYLHIFEVLRRDLDFAFNDLTFANITTLPARAQHLMRQFEVGGQS
jgi:adenylate cyclase class 2